MPHNQRQGSFLCCNIFVRKRKGLGIRVLVSFTMFVFEDMVEGGGSDLVEIYLVWPFFGYDYEGALEIDPLLNVETPVRLVVRQFALI